MKGKKGRGGHSSKGEGRCKTRGGKEMAEGGRGELVRERKSKREGGRSEGDGIAPIIGSLPAPACSGSGVRSSRHEELR